MEDFNQNIDLLPFLNKFLKLKEDEYLLKYFENEKVKKEEFHKKEEKLKQFYVEVIKKKLINSEKLAKLREFAVSKGGFLRWEYRYDLWLRILSLKSDNASESYLYIDNKYKNFKNNNIFISSSQSENTSTLTFNIK